MPAKNIRRRKLRSHTGGHAHHCRIGRSAVDAGFTLIELLVVVAIIAILAAIAVPNFLHAQVRAKVSRTHADLRTLATAVEAYSTDHNSPPYDGEPGDPFAGWATVLGRCTTPVAYLSSLPAPPFQDRTVTDSSIPGHTRFLDFPACGTHTYDYSTARWHGVPDDLYVTALWVRQFGASAWKMSNCGPDLRHVNDGSWFGLSEVYDPTNGTVSMGDIVRSPAGIAGFGR
jgi:prepilin-type N-terminal cleavage/methylation domain-containing protein